MKTASQSSENLAVMRFADCPCSTIKAQSKHIQHEVVLTDVVATGFT